MADDRIRVVIDADSGDLQRELRKAGAQVSAFGQQVDGQGRGMRAFSAATDKQRQTLHQLGRAAVVGGTAIAAGAALAVTHIVKTGMAYEAEMSRVKGVVDGTAEQMSFLNQIALKLGAQTKFSATEAAQGMYELGSAGFSAAQMGKALRGTLSLAAASNIELADAADIAAQAVKGFQLGANQTTHVADVLAKSTNTTALKMDDLQLSMKYIAPIAVTTGQSLEMMTAALGVMGDAGIRGEQAGTTLRAGLLRLVKPTSMVDDGLAQLGLTSQDLYGPDGLLPLPELVGKLAGGMDGLSQSQKAAALSAIFGQEAVSGMMTVIDAGPAKLDSLTRSFERADGASAKAAKTMQDNVPGALEQVKGSIESMEIAIYQQFEEPMKNALLEVSDAIDREGPQIQKAFQAAMATPEFKRGDLADQIRILGEVAQDEWKRLGLGDDLQQIFSDAVSAAIPVVAEGSARLGLAAAKGLINGFIDADVWGRLLIGTWLFTKLGGFAAMRAAGTQAGTQVAAGTAAGMATGETAITGAAMSWQSKIKGILTNAGWAAAAMISIQAATDAWKLWGEAKADDPIERLQQIESQGKGTQAVLGSMFDLIPDEIPLPGGLGLIKGGVDFLGLGDLKEKGEQAKRLEEILGQVNEVGSKRNAQLRAEGAEILQNIDYTEKEKEAVWEILNLKPQQASDAQAGIDKLASGYITRMVDITKLARKNASAAAEAYGQSTPEWRSAMARNMNATVMAIRAGMNDGVIEVGKGKDRIRQLLRRRDLVTGNDVGDIAKGFQRTWIRAGDINQTGINRILKDLGQMPIGARKRAASMMIQMAQAMEKNGRLPEGAASKLRSAIIAEFNIAASQGAGRIKRLQDAAAEGGRAWGRSLDGVGKDTRKGIDAASRELDRGKRKTDQVFDALDSRAKKWSQNFPKQVNKVNPPIENAIREMYSTMNKGLVPLGVEPVRFGVSGVGGGTGGSNVRGYAEGGVMRVAGKGLRDTVPLTQSDIAAMVAPGEDLAAINRHQRPLLDAAVAGAYGVNGLSGFFNTFNKPHDAPNGYATGGIVALGRQLQKEGYEVGEHPAFGGVAPVHTGGSYHYSGQALDVNDDGAPFGYGSSEQASLDHLYARLKKMPGVIELLWQVANHFDHLHVALGDGAAGSLMGGFQVPDPIKRMLLTGPDGPLTDMGQAVLDKVREAANRHLDSAVDSMGESFGAPTFGSASWKNELGKIAGAKGWSVADWMSLVMRESGGDPTATNPSSGAFGLGQFLGSTADAYAQYGAKSTDPVRQIQAMARYISDRYKTPSAALAFHDAHNWYDGGGFIKRLAEGGFVGNINRKYREHNSANGDWGGPKLPRYVIAALAQAAGMPGRTMEQVTRGESAGRPGATGVDPRGTKGYGLWMVTSGYNDALVKKYGGYGEMLNPVKNAAAAAEIYHSQGLGAWYGTGAVTGDGRPYTGNYKLTNALGGLGFNGALKGKNAPKGDGESKVEKRERAAEKRKRARIRRRRLRKLRARGIPRKMLRQDGRLVGRLAGLEDSIDQATTRSQWASSPGGEEQTPGETRLIVRLLQKELAVLRSRRKLLRQRIRQPLRHRLQEVEREIDIAAPVRIKKDGKWVKNPRHGNLTALKANRTSVREAIRDATANLRDVAGHNEKGGGEILRVKDEIRGYGAKASESERDSETADLLREQLRDSQRNLALGESQFGIFQQFLSGLGPGMPYLGAFAMGTGGKRVGRTGLAMLHEDEVVTPDPKGGYGTFASVSPASGTQPVVQITVAGDVAPLLNQIDARIDGKTALIEQKVDKSLGRKQRQMAVAPGR